MEFGDWTLRPGQGYDGVSEGELLVRTQSNFSTPAHLLVPVPPRGTFLATGNIVRG